MFLRPPRRARTVLAAVAGAAAFGLCWLIGMDEWHAAAVAVIVFAAGIAWIAIPEHTDMRMTEEPLGPREGVRREVIDLSWALRRQRGGIRENAFRRVRALAAERLAEHRLNLNDPEDGERIARAIGSQAYAILRSRSGRFANLRTVVHSLDALDRLNRDGS